MGWQNLSDLHGGIAWNTDAQWTTIETAGGEWFEMNSFI